MSFLTRLIARHQADGPTSFPRLEPRLPSRFEPVGHAANADGLERDVAIEAPRESEATAPRMLRHATRPFHDDGEPFETLAPRVRDLRSALSAARATVEVPAVATPLAPSTASRRAGDASAPAASAESVDVGASIPAVAAPSARRRGPALEPVPDRRPATSAAPSIRVAHERTAPRVPPTIHVSIGRVDVRAIVTPAAPSPRQPASDRLSLEDYLRGPSGRTR